MMNHIKLYEVYSLPTALNEYNEAVTTTSTFVTTIEMAVSLLTGSTINSNNVNTVNSTHIGITDYKALEKAQELRNGSDIYTIDFINGEGRKVLVYLKKVTANE